MALIELEGVTREYEVGDQTLRALDDVDFAAEAGEFVSIMGPSGSGKSTMLNILGLLDGPTSGRVRLDGRDVTDLSARELTEQRRRSLGFVFQNFYLVPALTAVENVELPSLFHDTEFDTTERAEDLLERVGLGDRLRHQPNELSGGQRQRVAIARSLVNSPRVLLADEPTGNLDRDTGETILEEFAAIKEEQDVAVVAVTHDEQLNEYADRVVELVDGTIRG